MYSAPNFTLARVLGGIIFWYWKAVKGKLGSTIIIIASGLILGEGLTSFVTLRFEALGLSHL